jgi:hypothetical protein
MHDNDDEPERQSPATPLARPSFWSLLRERLALMLDHPTYLGLGESWEWVLLLEPPAEPPGAPPPDEPPPPLQPRHRPRVVRPQSDRQRRHIGSPR